jgi:ABC-2 type transport system permease protein
VGAVTGSIAAIPEILRITIRQLLGRRRALLVVLLSAVPILLAVLIRAANGSGGDVDNFAVGILDAIALTLLLPLVAILFATAAFGAEIEDGTIVYLLAKPVARWAIVVAKLIAAFVPTAALTTAAALLAGAIAIGSKGQAGIDATVGFAAAMIVGSACYCAFFMALSLFTRRALIVGIGYWVVWEIGLSTLLPGISNLSIRQYALGAASVFYKLSVDEARVGPSTALPLAAILIVAAVGLSVWRLGRFELPGGGD